MAMYIIVEQANSILFIDKHAAHERIHFDALCKKSYKPMSQSMLTPIICRLGHEDAALLLEATEIIDDLGFTVESFGEDCVAVRHIPAEIAIDDAEQTLAEICVKLGQSGVTENTKRDSIYKIIACKAAIKAGRFSNQGELEKLAEKVMCGEVTHCPHGRPIVYKLTKTTLDKNLGRV
jgi:DNA mismatch repair protein MutL